MVGDDLRALDAEFAEKVLECHVVEDEVDGPLCRCRLKHHGDQVDRLEHYTINLTAAWAGVEKLDTVGVEFDVSCGDCKCDLQVKQEIFIGFGATPAEALVRACLEAVKDA